MSNIEGLESFGVRETARRNTIAKHIDNGVIFEGVDNVYIDDDVTIGRLTKIYNNNILSKGSRIAANCTLYSGNEIISSEIGTNVTVKSSYIDNSKIGNNCTVGPFANVHTNTQIARDCRVGNFVEIKNSIIGINTKMAHLAYIGDADIGDMCNIGCGTIFVNYDGKNKHRSYVGDSVFIGSNCNIIAPVKLEDNAFIAAGTTVTVNLPKNCMCIGRNREIIKENASKYRKLEYDKKYFGTDGIRGLYGDFVTEHIAYMCGNFLGYSANSGNIVVGRDTRCSGSSLTESLINGIIDAGCNVTTLGVTSSPCVAYITTMCHANYGIMITASHNSAEYNGIKIFNYDGRKLTNIEEIEIEKHIERNTAIISPILGECEQGESYINKYIDNLMAIFGSKLRNMRIVFDCANGGTSAIVSKMIQKLNIKTVIINSNSTGDDINRECGALHPEQLAKTVLETKANIGFALDGDGDRIIVVDECGRIVNGDQILYILSKYLKDNNRLNNNQVVGTIMSNLALERALSNSGITLLRTMVGDHYVIEEMLRNNLIVGGERSGHIIYREFASTGDGILIALFLTYILTESTKTLGELIDYVEYPIYDGYIRTTNNVVIVADKDVLNYVDKLREQYPDGRIIFRASGTEPVVRISAEYEDMTLCRDIVNRIIAFIYSKFP